MYVHVNARGCTFIHTHTTYFKRNAADDQFVFFFSSLHRSVCCSRFRSFVGGKISVCCAVQ